MSRIPQEFRQRVNYRIRMTMKPYIKGKHKVWTECCEAAEHLKLTPNTVWFWYEGHHLPNIYNLVRFAELYNVSLDYLLGRTAVKELAEAIKQVA